MLKSPTADTRWVKMFFGFDQLRSMLKIVVRSLAFKICAPEVAFPWSSGPAQWRYVILRMLILAFSRIDHACYSAGESD
jgi:hypothetical protein